MIIGLSGYAQAGKDTVGKFLIEDHGYVRYSFADVLRECLYALDPIICVDENPMDEWDGGYYARLVEVIDHIGWDEAKIRFNGVRSLLQRLGTEVGRNILGENVWVNAVFNKIATNADKNVVITDVRFPNEAQRIKDEGGYIARIQRPGVEAVNLHPSETSLDDWVFDYRISNEGTIDRLRKVAGRLVEGVNHLDTTLQGGPSHRLPGYGTPILR